MICGVRETLPALARSEITAHEDENDEVPPLVRHSLHLTG